MDAGQWIIIGLSVVLAVWYVVASTFNRRRGVASYHWLKAGLESLGKLTGASWIGSSGSGARLVVGTAQQPFRRIEVVFLLESREILPLWLFNRVRGKKDEMILKATLRKVPAGEVEVARSSERGFSAAVQEEGRLSLTPLPNLEGFQVAASRAAGSSQLDGLNEFLSGHPDAILRLSLRRGQPHLILRASLPELMGQGPGEDFFTRLSQWVGGREVPAPPTPAEAGEG